MGMWGSHGRIELIYFDYKFHENLKFLFWSRESEKPIFTNFPEFFYEKMGWNTESRVRRPGNPLRGLLRPW